MVKWNVFICVFYYTSKLLQLNLLQFRVRQPGISPQNLQVIYNVGPRIDAIDAFKKLVLQFNLLNLVWSAD